MMTTWRIFVEAWTVIGGLEAGGGTNARFCPHAASTASSASAAGSLPFDTLSSVTALARCEIVERGLQFGFAEVRPVGIGRPELGIGSLKKQKVREAKLAAGTDDEVGIR